MWKFVNNRNVFFYSGDMDVQDHMVRIDSMSDEDPFLKHGAINARREGNTNKTAKVP